MSSLPVSNMEPPTDERAAPEVQGIDFVTLAMFIIGR